MDEKELWVRFACAVIESYQIPEEIEETDDLIDDMATLAGKTADAMLDEYDKRFPLQAARPGRNRTTTRKPAKPE